MNPPHDGLCHDDHGCALYDTLVEGRMMNDRFGADGPERLHRLIVWSLQHRRPHLAENLDTRDIGVGSAADMGIFLRHPVYVERGWPTLYDAAHRYLALHTMAPLDPVRPALDITMSGEDTWAQLDHALLNDIFLEDRQHAGVAVERLSLPGSARELTARIGKGDTLRAKKVSPDLEVFARGAHTDSIMIVEVKAAAVPTFGNIAQVYTELMAMSQTLRLDHAFALLMCQNHARVICLSTALEGWADDVFQDERSRGVAQPYGRLRISENLASNTSAGRQTLRAALLACHVESLRRAAPASWILSAASTTGRDMRQLEATRRLLETDLPDYVEALSWGSACSLPLVVIQNLWMIDPTRSSTSSSMTSTKRRAQALQDEAELRLDPDAQGRPRHGRPATEARTLRPRSARAADVRRRPEAPSTSHAEASDAARAASTGVIDGFERHVHFVDDMEPTRRSDVDKGKAAEKHPTHPQPITDVGSNVEVTSEWSDEGEELYLASPEGSPGGSISSWRASSPALHDSGLAATRTMIAVVNENEPSSSGDRGAATLSAKRSDGSTRNDGSASRHAGPTAGDAGRSRRRAPASTDGMQKRFRYTNLR